MATTAIRQESILEQAKEGNSLWEKIRNFLDTVAFELSPFFGPVFSSQIGDMSMLFVKVLIALAIGGILWERGKTRILVGHREFEIRIRLVVAGAQVHGNAGSYGPVRPGTPSPSGTLGWSTAASDYCPGASQSTVNSVGGRAHGRLGQRDRRGDNRPYVPVEPRQWPNLRSRHPCRICRQTGTSHRTHEGRADRRRRTPAQSS